jgi:predicted RNA methylase
MATRLPSNVDTSRWDPNTDRKGRPVKPGDLVSFRTYPRGTARGRLELSDRAWTELADGTRIGALLIVTEDGTRYGPVTDVLLLDRPKTRQVAVGDRGTFPVVAGEDLRVGDILARQDQDEQVLSIEDISSPTIAGKRHGKLRLRVRSTTVGYGDPPIEYERTVAKKTPIAIHPRALENPRAVPASALAAVRAAAASAQRIPGVGFVVSMPQLDRKDYEQANLVLEALGGKWNRKLRGHVFTSDPLPKLKEVVSSGTVTIPKDEFDFFPTPGELAGAMARAADLADGQTVLEPSAGHGALVSEALAFSHPAKLVAIDLSPDNVAVLREKFGSRPEVVIAQGDFLALPEPPEDQKFERILMNPPFSGQGDVKHVLHAWDTQLLAGGRLVAIVSAGAMYRTDKPTRRLRGLIEEFGTAEDLPEGTFKEAGTNVKTVLITLDKPLLRDEPTRSRKPRSRSSKPKSVSPPTRAQAEPTLIVERTALEKALHDLLQHSPDFFVAYESHWRDGKLVWELKFDSENARMSWRLSIPAEGPQREQQDGPSEFMYVFDPSTWLARIEAMGGARVQIVLDPIPVPPGGMPEGSWVLVDHRHPAIVEQNHLSGCPNYSFPHYHIQLLGGNGQQVVAADRVSAGIVGPAPVASAAGASSRRAPPTLAAGMSLAQLKRALVQGTRLWWVHGGVVTPLLVEVPGTTAVRVSGMQPGLLTTLRWPKASGVFHDYLIAETEGSHQRAEIHWTDPGLSATKPASARRPASAPRPASAAEPEPIEHLIEDLTLTADNTASIYPTRQRIERQIVRQLREGAYDVAEGWRLWVPYLRAGVRAYGPGKEKFTASVIEATAKQYARDALPELRLTAEQPASRPTETRLSIMDEDLVGKLGRLEGMDWITRQIADLGRNRLATGVYANQDAYRVLRLGPDSEALAPFWIGDVLAGGGSIEGEHGRVYTIRRDGEVMLVEDTATPAFIERARAVLRIA